VEGHLDMNASRYLFASFTRSEALATAEIVVSTAAAVILGSSFSMSWFSLALSTSGLFLGVFLVVMFMVSLEISSKRREVAILRALGAKRSSLLQAFFLRVAYLAIGGCALGVTIGYCTAMLTAECSLLSSEIVGFAVMVSFISSFSGGAVAAKKVSYLKIGEVLRQ